MSVYNRFAPDKRWVALQAQSGRRLQSAELNEIQSLSLHRDKRMGDVIFGSGHIIEGGQIYVQDDKKKVIIFPATVYFDGVIHDIGEKRIPIAGIGEEIIGLKITYSTVTYEMQKELLDPAVGYANFGSPGMDRLVVTPEWVLNDAASIPMYRLSDGEVVTAKVPPELEGFTPVLARRTYDTSGSFLVSGMDGFIEPAEGDYVTLVIEAGKAYVLGYEINRLVPTRIKLKKSQDSRRVSDEVKTFVAGTTHYSLNSKPVKAIQEITARVKLPDISMTRGGSTAQDALPADAVVDIVSIVQGAKTYVKGKDYQLTENSVDWSIGTARPSIGETYKVTFEYMKQMVQGTDYKLEEGKSEVTWLGGDLPVAGSIFNVTYDYYLSRKDVFYLTADGQIQIVTGQSDVHPPSPPVPPDVLELGELQYPPASSDVLVVNNKPKRLTMLELRSLLDRLERAEYNQAMLELDRTAQISDPATFKKGFFTDNFTNFERADLERGFDAMIDPANQTLQLPVNQLFVQMEVESLDSVKQHERLLTLDYTEQLIIDQSYGTEALNVNPYQVFGSQATIRLTPSQDSWVETSYVYQTVWGWWDAWWTGNRSETRVILDENIPFIRQRIVTVYGEGFEPNSSNLQATFDGVEVSLVPANGYEAGTKPGTMKANGAGKFIATFAIPPNIRTGTREVRIFNYV
ncbi:protein of unknown function [Paenibacillus catalpae]|uniref:DUF4815 domain-containing protein n=1 Tax=Paenibacillus catalpae TaxID=1045775 RepID=A0A1I2BI90_9BACL|nr:DUF4815 domain-containing protein [Paenibacillus catalpae]SFE54900.1 protein of unknown function [Paenibacillus catalpae]